MLIYNGSYYIMALSTVHLSLCPSAIKSIVYRLRYNIGVMGKASDSVRLDVFYEKKIAHTTLSSEYWCLSTFAMSPLTHNKYYLILVKLGINVYRENV